LLKKYSKLWVFGDSFSTPDVCVDPKNSFWGLTATALGVDTVINGSRPANSFDSVCQLVVGMQQEINWPQDLVLIGIPPLERITVFDNHKDTAYTGHQFDPHTWQKQSVDMLCHRGLVSLQNYGTDKTLVLHNDRSWLETQTLRTVFFLTTWLDSIDANYMILNLSKDLDDNNVWGPSTFVLDYCLNHPRCILFKDTYHGINLNKNIPADFDQFGWSGHHGSVGNQYFFEHSLWPKMKQCNLI
jgi:hypothetical protein